jgi:hypothetical protein
LTDSSSELPKGLNESKPPETPTTTPPTPPNPKGADGNPKGWTPEKRQEASDRAKLRWVEKQKSMSLSEPIPEKSLTHKSNPSETPDPLGKLRRLSKDDEGTIAAIVIGLLAGACLLAVALFYLTKKKAGGSPAAPTAPAAPVIPPEIVVPNGAFGGSMNMEPADWSGIDFGP